MLRPCWTDLATLTRSATSSPAITRGFSISQPAIAA